MCQIVHILTKDGESNFRELLILIRHAPKLQEQEYILRQMRPPKYF